jgi:hypothetical protein
MYMFIKNEQTLKMYKIRKDENEGTHNKEIEILDIVLEALNRLTGRDLTN